VPVPWTPSYLNSAGISPMDGKVYATVRTHEDSIYLIRFDETKVEFLAKLYDGLEFDRFPSFNAGAMATDGTFYIHNQARSWSMENADELTGYASYDNTSIPDWSATEPTVTSTVSLGADFVVLDTDKFEGGITQRYAIGAGNGYIGVINLDTGVGWELEASTMSGTWGSAWLYDGNVYVASNTGTLGVYRVQVDLIANSVKTTHVANSAMTGHNDGMNCLDVDDPFDPPTFAPAHLPTSSPKIECEEDVDCPVDKFCQCGETLNVNFRKLLFGMIQFCDGVCIDK